MKPLKTLKQMLVWICVCQPNKITSKWKKRAFFANLLAGITIIMAAGTASLLFFLKFISIDLESSLDSLYPAAAGFGLAYTLLMAYLLRHKMNAIFDDLSNIYDTSKNY